MGALAFAVASTVLVLPREYHIDCSGWPGGAVVEIKFRITNADRTTYKSAVEIQPGASAQDVRNAIKTVVRKAGYDWREIGDNILVLEGKKKTPVRSVEFKSESWKPVVRTELVISK